MEKKSLDSLTASSKDSQDFALPQRRSVPSKKALFCFPSPDIEKKGRGAEEKTRRQVEDEQEEDEEEEENRVWEAAWAHGTEGWRQSERLDSNRTYTHIYTQPESQDDTRAAPQNEYSSYRVQVFIFVYA